MTRRRMMKSRFNGGRCSVCGKNHISRGETILTYVEGWASKECYDAGIRSGDIVDEQDLRRRMHKIMYLRQKVFETTGKHIGDDTMTWEKGLKELLSAGIITKKAYEIALSHLA